MSEIIFSSVKEAVRWSEETALMPDIQSSMRLLTSSGGSALNHNEAVDIAQTVTNITANCKPFKGMAAKAVFSPCSTAADDRDLGIIIAAKMQQMPEAKGKHYEKLITLGIGAIRSKRAVELYNNRYPVKKIARDLGISRERLYKSKNWKVLKIEADQRLLSMVLQAEIEIFSELSIRGWIM